MVPGRRGLRVLATPEKQTTLHLQARAHVRHAPLVACLRPQRTTSKGGDSLTKSPSTASPHSRRGPSYESKRPRLWRRRACVVPPPREVNGMLGYYCQATLPTRDASQLSQPHPLNTTHTSTPHHAWTLRLGLYITESLTPSPPLPPSPPPRHNNRTPHPQPRKQVLWRTRPSLRPP